jgi:hypothetical protein
MKLLTTVSIAGLSAMLAASAFACEGYKPTDASAAPPQLNLASAPPASKLPSAALDTKVQTQAPAAQPAGAAPNTAKQTAKVAKN